VTTAHLWDPDRRPTRLRFALLALVAAQPLVAAATDAAAGSPVALSLPREERIEHRSFFAPGMQFGAQSQELSVDLVRARIATNLVGPDDDFRRLGGSWAAGGIRVAGVAHEWSPAAVHGLLYVSTGGWGWEWWPFGLEFAVGGGHGGSSTYGLLQLSYVLTITHRFETFAAYQAPFGDRVDRPEWLSRWLFGARVGFDVARVRRERVRIEPDASPEPPRSR
jgi:hypothetical protein